MRITWKQWRGKDVKTTSGIVLGRVVDAVIDLESHAIAQYIVKSSRISTKEYLIHPSQIIRVEADAIIVADTLESSATSAKEKRLGINPNPIALREKS